MPRQFRVTAFNCVSRAYSSSPRMRSVPSRVYLFLSNIKGRRQVSDYKTLKFESSLMREVDRLLFCKRELIKLFGEQILFSSGIEDLEKTFSKLEAQIEELFAERKLKVS
jgi:hypothetical protein